VSDKFGGKYYDLTLNALRIVAGFLLMIHGGQKLFGWFGAPGSFTEFWPFGVAGILEFFGGLAIALGLFTRYVAFVEAGEMAVVYFWMHVARNGSVWPWANRGGEVPALFCFIFLFVWASGGGSRTLDAWLAKRKAL
jgi:putative oxidoreductase